MVSAGDIDLEYRMYELLSQIRGPLYDHDMHGWEGKCDALVAEYLAVRERKPPEITVKVAREGRTVKYRGNCYMRAIGFLCDEYTKGHDNVTR